MKFLNHNSRQKSFRLLTRWVSVLLLVSWFSSTALGMVSASGTDQQRVLMCTQNGYQWVTISADEAAPSTVDPQHCVFCFLQDADAVISKDHYSLAAFFDACPLVNWRTPEPLRAVFDVGRWHIDRAPPL